MIALMMRHRPFSAHLLPLARSMKTESSAKINLKNNQTPIAADEEHISRRIARAGLLSRRMAMRYVDQGRVQVNGRVLTRQQPIVRADDCVLMDGRIVVPASSDVGKSVDNQSTPTLPEDGEEIARLNRLTADTGRPLKAFIKLPADLKLWMFYKRPRQIVSQYDNKRRPTIFEHLRRHYPQVAGPIGPTVDGDDQPHHAGRLLSIGRLDYHAEGLLLLTNDGELKRRLEHPGNRYARGYLASVRGQPPASFLAKHGVQLIGGDGSNGGQQIHAQWIRDNEAASSRAIAMQQMVQQLDRRGGDHWLLIRSHRSSNVKLPTLLQDYGLELMRLIRHQFGPYRLDLAGGGGGMRPGELRECDLLQVPVAGGGRCSL